MPGSWGNCPGPRGQDSCLRVRRTGCQGLRVGERWPGFQAVRTGRKRALSEHLLCAHNCLLPRPGHTTALEVPRSLFAEEERLLDRNKAFPSQPSFPTKAESVPRPSARVSSLCSTSKRLPSCPRPWCMGKSPRSKQSCVETPSQQQANHPSHHISSKHSQRETQGLQNRAASEPGMVATRDPEACTPQWLRTVTRSEQPGDQLHSES